MSLIKAIFFARFHPEKGPRILHQVPEGIIGTGHHHSAHDKTAIFPFSAVSQHVIPAQEFCDGLITICTCGYRVIGFPVCVRHSRYLRNQFIFNLCFVLEDGVEFNGYATVVRRLAALFRNLEEQSMFLSKQEDDNLWAAVSAKDACSNAKDACSNAPDAGQSVGRLEHFDVGGKMYALCEMVFEDLNNYCECMIPIGGHAAGNNVPSTDKHTDDFNTINLKLFPTRPPPPPVYAWHVPLSTVQLATLANSSDLTLTRVVPHIDGIASVAQIAQLTDTDLKLTRKAIAHLLYYNCVVLLDIFQFNAIYAPTAEFSTFVVDEDAQDEAIRYIWVDQARRLHDAELKGDGQTGPRSWTRSEGGLDRVKLLQLYASLRQGLSLKNWCLAHGPLLLGLDVRRFVTFGIIKGFLYRVHKYIVLDDGSTAVEATGKRSSQNKTMAESTFKVVSWQDQRPPSNASSTEDMSLSRYLDGMHCLDEICTELCMSEGRVLERIKHIHQSNAITLHR